MAKDMTQLQIPAGVHDLLPGEARAKRQLEDQLAGLFASWAYEEVVTPTMEYLTAIAVDTGEEIQDHLFQFFDRQGKILALRPEMTTPIARLAATRLKNAPLPLRLFYIANVFRYEDTQAGKQREFFQAGVELLGAQGAAADAEVLALACESLLQAGLQDFQLSLGQIEVFNGIMDELAFSPEEQRRIRNLVAKKDFVGLEEFLAQAKISSNHSELLLQLPAVHGGKEVLARAGNLAVNRRAEAGLKNLEQVYNALEAFGVDDYVAIDLGVLRGFDYYTGVVFEGYTSGIGFPICGGGRYDNLLSQFGFGCPATGFALGLERVMLALSRQKPPAPPRGPEVLLWGEDLAALIAKAKSLRSQGLQVEVDTLRGTLEETRQYAKKRCFARLLRMEKGSFVEETL